MTPHRLDVPAAPGAGRIRWFLHLLLCATILGAGLRLYKLDAGSFWLDELYTIRSIEHLSDGQWQWIKVLGYIPSSIGFRLQGLDPAALDSTDPSGWRAAGFTEFRTRLPTALLGIASIPLLALASRRLLGDRGAIMLALLLATSPWHIYWSQAARFYVVQFLLYNLALVLYFSATRPLSRSRLIVALALAVLAFMSQPTSLIIGVIFAADWLLAAARRRANDAVSLGLFGWAAAAGAICCCILIFAADAIPGRDGLAHAVSDPLGQTPRGVVLASAYLIWPSTIAFAMLSAVYLWRRDRRFTLYFTIAAVFPVAFFAALAAIYPVGSRYAFVGAFAWIILAAVGADAAWSVLRPRVGAALAAGPIAVLVTSSLIATAIAYNSGGNLHARWGEAVRAVDVMRGPGEPVYASTPYIASYYLGEPALPLPSSPEEVDAIPHTAWFVIDAPPRPATRRFWLLENAELIDSYHLRAPHTDSSVQIFRHTPGRSR